MSENKNTDLMNRPFEYTLDTGEPIRITMGMVRRFLVTGKRELVTDQEIFYFLSECKSRKLNPFLRECWLIKYSNDPAQIITSIHFIRKKAMENPRCRGWESGLFLIGEGIPSGEYKRSHGLVLPRQEVIGAWFISKPDGFVVPYTLEINLSGYIKRTREGEITAFWQPEKQPTQLIKVVEAQGLRNLYLNNWKIYLQEEMGFETPESEPIDIAGTPDYGGDPETAGDKVPSVTKDVPTTSLVDPEAPVDDADRTEPDKKYKCEACDFYSVTERGLRRHKTQQGHHVAAAVVRAISREVPEIAKIKDEKKEPDEPPPDEPPPEIPKADLDQAERHKRLLEARIAKREEMYTGNNGDLKRQKDAIISNLAALKNWNEDAWRKGKVDAGLLQATINMESQPIEVLGKWLAATSLYLDRELEKNGEA